MTNASNHPGDRLQELLDGRLDPAARGEVEDHVAACPRCRQELESLRWLTGRAVRSLPRHGVPRELEARIAAGLDGVDQEAHAAQRRARLTRQVAVAAVLLATAAVVALLVRRPTVVSPAAIARDFTQVRGGAIALDLATSDPARLERWFVEAGIAFPTRVFDFGMMGYDLLGGRVHAVGTRRSALFAYRGPSDRRVICQMYQGRLEELPADAGAEREHDGIVFRVYRRDGLTLVFWQEGDVVCVLVSDGDPDEAIQLARAKAVRV